MNRRPVGLYPKWLNRDATLIILARGIRTFAQSFVAVLLALYLTELGFSLVQVGVFLSVGVAGIAFFAFLVSLAAGLLCRRHLLEVWPESHLLGFALRQPDVLQSYTTY